MTTDKTLGHWTLMGARDQRTPASDGRLGEVLRTMVVERSSGEETVTSSMRVGLRPSVEAEHATSRILPVERPSGEVHATDIASGAHSAIGAHPPVDRASTDVLETDGALTEPRRASRTPSAYRASTETGTEGIVPVMNTTAGGPNVDRTPTGGGETLALTSVPLQRSHVGIQQWSNRSPHGSALLRKIPRSRRV